MNLEILKNGVTTGRVVVNTTSEESARKLCLHFGEATSNELSFKDISDELTVPSVFENCIMPK